MLKKTMIVAMAVLLAVAIAGCGDRKYEPRAINADTDKCAQCNMQVKDDAFAVQLTTKDGKTYTFDDIGCMHKWKQAHAEAKIGGQFVRDFRDLTWVAYEDAYYAYDASFRSPMAYGVYSFKDQASAQAFLDERQTGKLMTAENLDKHNWMQNMEQMKKDKMGTEKMSGDHDEHAHEIATVDASMLQAMR